VKTARRAGKDKRVSWEEVFLAEQI
jgi:hypothetical protein